ncbi:MAG TPA: VWA domain-containing protein [Terriglobales bacterium]|nr:VWA domain-containing protein [Terriglobales bacterium]
MFRTSRAAGLSLLLSTLLVAQEIPTISVNVKVVNVLATVRDKQGRIVNSLAKEDFLLEEDGHPQVIKYFTRETDLPLTLGLLVDTSLSQLRVLDEERDASAAFVNDVLRADRDSAFLIRFDFDVELLQDLTTSPLKIQSALNELTSPRRHDYSGTPVGQGGGTHFYDSVFLASDELMQKQKGRKALVILTDGVDQGSKVTIDRAVEAAQRADTVVYTVLFSDEQAYGGSRGGRPHISIGGPWGRGGSGWPGSGTGWPGGGGRGGVSHGDGKKVLERISRETGGRMFEVTAKQNVTQIYSAIQDELRNQYNLGYSSDQPTGGNDYRKIKLITREKGYKVQARDGYYADTKQQQASK